MKLTCTLQTLLGLVPVYPQDLLLSAKLSTNNKPFVVYPNSGEMYVEKRLV